MWHTLVDGVRQANGFAPYHKRRRQYVYTVPLGPVHSAMAPVLTAELRGLPVPIYDVPATLATLEHPIQTAAVAVLTKTIREHLTRYSDVVVAIQAQEATLRDVKEKKKAH